MCNKQNWSYNNKKWNVGGGDCEPVKINWKTEKSAFYGRNKSFWRIRWFWAISTEAVCTKVQCVHKGWKIEAGWVYTKNMYKKQKLSNNNKKWNVGGECEPVDINWKKCVLW